MFGVGSDFIDKKGREQKMQQRKEEESRALEWCQEEGMKSLAAGGGERTSGKFLLLITGFSLPPSTLAKTYWGYNY